MLTLNNLSKYFGSTAVLQGFSYHFQPKTVYALMGANGSGKTTLFNVIGGFLEADEGVMSLQGKEISQLAPHKIANLGLARTFQDMRLIPTLSVYDNVLLTLKEKPSEQALSAFYPIKRPNIPYK